MTDLPDLAILGDRLSRYRTRLLGVANGRMEPGMRRRVSAEEILQEAFIKAAGKWERSKQSAPIDSFVWWYGLVRDCAIDACRAQTRDIRDIRNEVAMPSRSSVLLCARMLNENRPSKAVALRESRQAAIDQLSEAERELLWMRQYDQLSHREIAELLDCSYSAATQRYGAVMEKLRKRLKELRV